MNTTETTTTIPERQYRTEDITTQAVGLETNDLIVGVDGSTATVTAVDTKRTWTWVTLSTEAQPVRFRPSEEVTVRRQVETDESVAARDAARLEQRSRDLIEGYGTALTKARDELAKELLESKTSWVSKDKMGNVLALQAMYYAIAQYLPNDPDVTPDFTYTAVVRGLQKRFTRDLLEDINGPTWSGGFSWTNAEAQGAQDAKRSFLRSIDYWFED